MLFAHKSKSLFFVIKVGAIPPCSREQRVPGANFERKNHPTLLEPINEKKKIYSFI